MILIKKIDCYGQLILVTCMLLSIPFLYFVGVGIGLIILRCWQLISALFNTYCFIDCGYKKPVLIYWVFCIADLGLFFLALLFENTLSIDYTMIIFWITIGAAVFIAGYYLRIYYRLIDLLSLRNELDGLTKSKH
jgi:hypothetical protein